MYKRSNNFGFINKSPKVVIVLVLLVTIFLYFIFQSNFGNVVLQGNAIITISTTPAQIQALSSTQVATNFSSFTQPQKNAVTTAQIQGMTATQVGVIFQSLTQPQKDAVTATQVGGMTETQVGAILLSLNQTQIGGVTAAQIASIEWEHIRSLDSTRVNVLKGTPEKKTALKNRLNTFITNINQFLTAHNIN